MDNKTLTAARVYVRETANSLGAVKGSPCTIKSIAEGENGSTVVFSWTGADGVEQTSSTFLPRGPQGIQGEPGKDGSGVDAEAREQIAALSEEIAVIKDANYVTDSGDVVSVTAAADASISVEGETTGEVTLVHQGKNFMAGLSAEGTVNGVTKTINEDGTVHLSGTPISGVAYIDFGKKTTPFYLPAGNYMVSASFPLDSGMYFQLSNVDAVMTVNPSPKLSPGKPKVNMVVSEGGYVYSHFGFYEGVTIDVDIWAQIELVSTATGSTAFEKPMRYETVTDMPTSVKAFEGTNVLYTTTGDLLNIRTSKSESVAIDEKIAEALKFDASVYGLPVLTLDGDCTGMTKDDYVNLAFTFQDKDGNALSGNVDVKKQGSSSVQTGVEIGAAFDTDLGGLFNFTLKFPEAFEAKEGWTAQKKYCFKANAIDHSHARNVCSCKLWGQIVKSRADVPTELSSLVNGGAIDGFPIIIVLNGNFYALGTFNIPKDGWMFGSPKAILCADDHTDATKFKALATLDGDFELEYVEDENNADWVLTSINTAIQAVMNSDGSDLDTVGQYIDIPSAIDYYIHAVYEQATDGTDKNYILVTFDGVKWYFSAYDRDTTYGIWWNGKLFVTPASNITYANYASNHGLMNLIYTHKKAELKARSVELRNSVLSEANVTTVFTNFTAGIPAELFAQNCRRWPLLRSTSVSNVNQILNWYRLRRAYIDPLTDALA